MQQGELIVIVTMPCRAIVRESDAVSPEDSLNSSSVEFH